jgi:hypothetical protein
VNKISDKEKHMNNYQKLITALCLPAMLAVAGCSSQQSDPSACALSGTSNAQSLFAEVEDKLQNSSCHYSWPSYQARLVAVAKGSPGPENEARFAQLLRTGMDRGIISKKQGQEMFSRYFDPEFYTVKSEARSSCSALNHKEQLFTDMRRELDYKREGMLEVLNDEDRFRQAQQHYADLRLVFDAIEYACGAA